jgi:hypothetical protein
MRQNEKKRLMQKKRQKMLAQNDTSFKDFDEDALLELNWYNVFLSFIACRLIN